MIESSARTFAQFMEDALYGSDGYYATGRAQSGREGDYFTAPDVGPVFAHCLAWIFETWQERLGAAVMDFVECGAGEGALAEKLVASFSPERVRYTAVERSPSRRTALQNRLSSRSRVVADLETLMRQPTTGILFANELLDAFPVHRVRMQNGNLQEGFVRGEGRESKLIWGPPSTPQLDAYLQRVHADLSDGYETEINLEMRHWITQAAAGLKKGVVVLIDYGRPAHELFAPERDRGTLRAFYNHQVSNDVLSEPGHRDLTSDVDFTSLVLDARDVGLLPLAFMELGSFLLQGAAAREWSEKERRGLRYLVHPEGMGGAFHVLVLGKDLDGVSWEFEHNRLRRLGLS